MREYFEVYLDYIGDLIIESPNYKLIITRLDSYDDTVNSVRYIKKDRGEKYPATYISDEYTVFFSKLGRLTICRDGLIKFIGFHVNRAEIIGDKLYINNKESNLVSRYSKIKSARY